jgi:hypothetical protein
MHCVLTGDLLKQKLIRCAQGDVLDVLDVLKAMCSSTN